MRFLIKWLTSLPSVQPVWYLKDIIRRFAATLLAAVVSLFAAAGFAQTTTFAAKQVSVGSVHSCAVTTSGGVKCWGQNFYGQLGDGTNIDRLLPVDVVGLTSGVTAIAAGGSHTCAMLASGGVKCWGVNTNNELGDGTSTSRTTPVDVVGLVSGVTAISGNTYITCVIITGGVVKCWGANGSGQLGNGTSNTSAVPITVPLPSTGMTSIRTSSGGINCAWSNTSAVSCWGAGLFPDGSTSTTIQKLPTDMPSLSTGNIDIGFGVRNHCVLATTGAKCWGYSIVDDATINNNPTSFGALAGATSIVGGDRFACALINNGVKCWGAKNNVGQIGDGTIIARATPTDVVGLTSGVASVATTQQHTCVVMTTGAVKCWGNNAYGQIGDSTTTNSPIPVDVKGSGAATTAQPQIFGGVRLDAGAARALVVRSSSNQLQAGRLVNNVFQFSNLADPGANYRIVAATDMDNNGRDDLVIQDITQGEFGDVYVWRDFNSASSYLLRKVKRVWDVQAVGDLDGDGFGDLVWRYTVLDSPDTGVSYIWFTDGNTVKQVRKRGGAPLTWTLLGAADLNGDGAVDMVYVSPDNNIRVLMGTPSRTCANLSAGSIPAGFTALKFGDFTGSRRGEVLIRNATTGAIQILQLNATGLTLPPYTGAPDDQNASCTASALVVSNQTIVLPTIDITWQFYGIGDYNGDGILDILWLRADGTLTLWLMQVNGAAPIVIANAGTAPFFAPATPPANDLYSAVTAKATADFLALLPIACPTVTNLSDGAKTYENCLEDNSTPAKNIAANMWYGGLPFKTGSFPISGPVAIDNKITINSVMPGVSVGDACTLGIAEPFIPIISATIKGTEYAPVVGKPFNFKGTINDAISIDKNGRVFEYTMTNGNGYKIEMHPNLALFDSKTSGQEGILGTIVGTSFTNYYICTK